MEDYFRYLNSGDIPALEYFLEAKFEDDQNSKDGPIRKTLESYEHIASSIQYDSQAMGQWIRIRIGRGSYYDPKKKTCGLSHAETEYSEELYRLAPRQKNLLFSDDLISHIQVKFGGNQESNVFHVPKSLWIMLENEIRNQENIGIRDFKKYILNEPEHGYKFNGCQRAIKKVAKDFKNSLESVLVKTAKRTLPLNKNEDAFRLFIFTFFYTIMLDNDIKKNHQPIYHLIISLREGDSHIGSYCGAFHKKIEQSKINILKAAFTDLVRRFYTIESLALQRQVITSFASVEGENIIRLCSIVADNSSHDPPDMKRLEERLRNLSMKLKCGNDKVEIKGADPKFLSVIEELCTYAWECGLKKGTTIFLYGEPGLGKEELAILIHSFNHRSHEKDLGELIKKAKNRLPKEYKEENKNYWESARSYTKYDANGGKSDFIINEDRTINTNSWKENKIFNFIEVHARELKVTDYKEWFIGGKEKPGMLSRLHLLGGTFFLDEVHTIDKSLLLEFHKVWGNPYHIKPERGEEFININVFTIFASNRSPDQLKANGFDEAILSRMTQFARYIPPLRERKQDIALLINHFIYEKNNDKNNKKIKFIDPYGLRLLTELSWKDTNVRGVKQFVDELLQYRSKKDVKGNKVTFDEIVQCAKRRQLL